jgi:hypothetical protein
MRTGLYAVALISLIAVVLSGCTDVNDQFIQGTWYYNDPHLNSIAAEQQQETIWSFDRGTFEQYSCCFSGEHYMKGQYRILDSKEDSLSLELFNIKGGATQEPVTIKIVIEREADSLSIQHVAGFTRQLAPGR